ncbi:MAG: copper chaperone PCu(A)C [Xanthobacteraceae bacterium]
MTNFSSRSIARGVAATFALFTASFVLAQFAASPAAAADYDIGSMHISQPWARATPKGADDGAGYMTITNKGSAPDRVSCVSDDASKQCQIHSMTMEGGIMKMRPVEGGLEIKPGETVTLKPGGYHMMFVDLTHPLEQGKSVEAELKFDHAGTVKVDYPIAAIGAPAPGTAAGGGTMMMQGPSGGAMSGPGGGMQMGK